VASILGSGGTQGGHEKCVQKFCRETWREETTRKT